MTRPSTPAPRTGGSLPGSVRSEPAAARARVFVLSPANLGGTRGRRLLDGSSRTPLAARLHSGSPVPLGDVYAFVSSLYYRGKRTYAQAFGRRADGGPASLVITPCRGLMGDHEPVGLADLATFASTDIAPENRAYRSPLVRSAAALDEAMGGGGDVVLLGSIASAKYLEPLAEVFGERLLFPGAFPGRGDMSRGGLLLHAAAAGVELEYVVALSAERSGPRPPRLGPRARA